MTRAHLSATLPSFQFAWDSTSLGSLKTCPRKYQYVMLENWRPKNTSYHLTFGIWFHKGPEIYDKLRAGGLGHEDALRTALREVMEGTEGWESGDPKKNRENLLRTIVWYLDQYEHDPVSTYLLPNGAPAVELSFRFYPNIEVAGEQILLCGHLDKVGVIDDRLYVMDKKTTGSAMGEYFFHQFNPNSQMSLYTIAGKVVLEKPISGVIIDGAQIGATFSRFGRGFTHRTSVQSAEWLRDLEFHIGTAARCAKEGYWPQNDAACGMYGGCDFREICGKDPAVREAFLSSSFERVEWNPLESRE